MDLIFAVGWEGFIIPGIAFVIWVISSLAGGKNPPPNPKAGAKNLGPGNRAPLSDLERFFQEAKQRRAKPDTVPIASLNAEPSAPKVKQRPTKSPVKRSKIESTPNPFLIDQIASAFFLELVNFLCQAFFIFRAYVCSLIFIVGHNFR